jgi:hypothetical protein
LRISIALCTYNGDRWLPEQLRSLGTQRRQPDELVVFDDCSTDETRRVLADFAASARFPVRVQVNAERVGSSANFERAIAACEGDVIAICDQDDVWHDAKLARIEDALGADPSFGLAFSDATLVDDDLAPLGLTTWQVQRFGPDQLAAWRQGDAFRLLLVGRYVTGATVAFRERLRGAVLPFPPMVRESRTLWLLHDAWISLVAAAVDRVVAIDEELILYRQHPGQQLGLAPQPRLRSVLRQKVTGRDPPDTSPPRAHITAEVQIEVVETVRRRLRDLQGPSTPMPGTADHEAEMTALLAHLGMRAGLADRRWARIPPVVRELLSGRYHRFAGGPFSALADLLAPGPR